MTQSELIEHFPDTCSIRDRVLLICPDMFPLLCGLSVQECRIFMLVTHGSAMVKTGATQTVITANNFVDMLVWEPISFISMSHDLRAWCLLPNYVFTNEALNALKPADSESFKDRHTMPLLKLLPDETSILESQLKNLHTALGNISHHYRQELCQTFFRSFMLETGNIVLDRQAAHEDTESVENRQDTIVRSFLKLVWKYYQSEHNLDFYAERLCISSKHLSRVVRHKLGKTPYAVIRDELFQRATYLLKDTKMSIQEIAVDLHFSEMAAFCKFFKKHHGMTPTAFRSSVQAPQT